MRDVNASPSLTAIVVNWDGASLLVDCLTSLAEQNPPVEVIVVDNGSTDDSETVARSLGAIWLPLGSNRGLAAAFNAGVERATAPLLVFLNNDLALPPGFASWAVSAITSGIGAIDVAHAAWDGGGTTHARTVFDGGRRLDDSAFPEVSATKRTPCAYASGACFLVERHVFDSVGGWDGGYFAGWEDVDLSWRLRSMGLSIEFEPRMEIRHHVSASSRSKRGHAIREYAALTGRCRFALKHAPARVAFGSLGRLLLGSTVAVVRSPRRLPLRARAVHRTFVDLPGLLAWRRRHYRDAGTSPAAIWRETANITRAD